MISISVMQSMTTKDYARILRYLRGGPKTCKEVAAPSSFLTLL